MKDDIGVFFANAKVCTEIKVFNANLFSCAEHPEITPSLVRR